MCWVSKKGSSSAGARARRASKAREAHDGWTFVVIYLGYKWIQRNKKLSTEERERRYSAQHLRSAQRLYKLDAAWAGTN